MNNEQLERSLNSTGKGCFVKYFEQFSSESLSNEDFIDLLMREESYKESGSRTRVTQARRIIRAGRAVDALLIVSSSTRVPDETAKEASRIACFLQR